MAKWTLKNKPDVEELANMLFEAVADYAVIRATLNAMPAKEDIEKRAALWELGQRTRAHAVQVMVEALEADPWSK